MQLNKALTLEVDLFSKHSEAFSVAELHEIRKATSNARSSALPDVYEGHDNRAVAYTSFHELLASQKTLRVKS